MRIGGLSKEELKELFREAIEEALVDLFGDPDEGLQLHTEIRERLKRSLERIQQGETGISAEEVAKQKGLTW
jgi:hypothetical protein